MSNLLYYAQVNDSVRNEIILRAESAISRTNKDLAFMLEKIANVQVLPYDSDTITKDSEPIEEAILGGFKMREGSFQPNTNATAQVLEAPELPDPGFLENNVYRTKPYLSQVSIETYDQSRGFLNRGKIDIVIPDSASDMDLIESVYCKPGRTLKLVIQHPDSAVLSDKNELADDELVDYETLLATYPNVTEDEVRKLNLVTFNGKISNFTFSYDPDGSVKLTVDILGTTGTYINANMYIGASNEDEENPETNPDNSQTKKISDFYTELETLVKDYISGQEDTKNGEISITDENTGQYTGKSILYGNYYAGRQQQELAVVRGIDSLAEGTQHKFVSLGFLIDQINKKIINATTNTETDQQVDLVCDDVFCKSNYRELLVSADPTRILLWKGTNDKPTTTYPYPAEGVVDAIQVFSNVTAVTPGFLDGDGTKVAYPARIYINLTVIDELIEQTEQEQAEPSVKHFLNKLSKEISKQLGGEISMNLIEHPLQSNILLYYDTSYIDDSIGKTEEFLVPAYGLKGRTAVRELSITTNVPESVKSMIYGLDAKTKSFNATTVYSPYVFASEETRAQIEADYSQNHEDAKNELFTAEDALARAPESLDGQGPSGEIVARLQKALKGYIMYPTNNIQDSIASNNPAFPMEISVTFDGINGFKYGDVMNFSGIPNKYQRTFAFMVIGITHTVSNDGDWTTQLQLKARIKQT